MNRYMLNTAYAAVVDPGDLLGKVSGIADRVANFFSALLFIIAVFIIVIASIRYLSSGGDKEKVAATNKMVLWAVVAVAMAFLSKGIVAILRYLITG